jgi:thiamine-phosphate diphosphorylase
MRAKKIQGLYGIADSQNSPKGPTALAQQLLDGGCRILQLRCKDWQKSEIEQVAREIKALCGPYEALFFINDYPDIAQAVGADGVHLGQSDLSTAEVRKKYGTKLLIGRSTNALEHIAHTITGADYLAFGPVFETTNLSRPKATQGLELLRQARSQVPNLPLVAIGGITKDRLPLVRDAGVDAWAVISAIAHSQDPVATTRSLCA